VAEPASDAVARVLMDYFGAAPSAAVDTFRAGIDACIQAYLGAERITSAHSMDDLRADFSASTMPEQPGDPARYVRFLQDGVIPHVVNVGDPRYVGHMTSALPGFLPPLSQLLTTLNQNIVKVETSRVLTLIERQTLAMMHRLVFGEPDAFYDAHIQNRESNLGVVVSCGTLANITAMWIARNQALRSSDEFLGLQSEGFVSALRHYGYRDAVIIGSELMHYSMDKLGSLLGLGAENIIKIGVGAHGALDVAALEEIIAACKAEGRLVTAIVGIAGTTETGAIDDLPALATVSEKHGIHFHVDAAWGGPILFSDRHRHILRGIERADTVTICGHKQLYLPQGISMVLCRDPKAIYHIKAMARYQARAESYDLGKHSPEGSRPAMSLYLHASLQLLGRQGYAFLIDEGIRKARLLAALIDAHPAFELIEQPQTNLVVYRYIPAEMRAKVHDGSFTREDQYVINCVNELLQDQEFMGGRGFISRTTLAHGRNGSREPIVVLRAVLANPLTTEDDLRAVLDDQVETGDIVLEQRAMSFAQVLKLLYQQTSSFDRQ
jgi:glutamate decarboxylase